MSLAPRPVVSRTMPAEQPEVWAGVLSTRHVRLILVVRISPWSRSSVLYGGRSRGSGQFDAFLCGLGLPACTTAAAVALKKIRCLPVYTGGSPEEFLPRFFTPSIKMRSFGELGSYYGSRYAS